MWDRVPPYLMKMYYSMLGKCSLTIQLVDALRIGSKSNFQETGIKPQKTRKFTLTSGFCGLRYAQHTKTRSKAVIESRLSPNSALIGRRQKMAARLDCGKKEQLMADSREVMNIRQASQYLGVSADTLYKYVGEQKIPAFKLGNRWRFKKSKLDQWMEEKSNQMEERVSRKKPKVTAKAAGQP